MLAADGDERRGGRGTGRPEGFRSRPLAQFHLDFYLVFFENSVAVLSSEFAAYRN